MQIPQSPGTLLQQRRLELGYKQDFVASRLGISRSRLSRIENGWLTPTTQEVVAMRSLLGILVSTSRRQLSR